MTLRAVVVLAFPGPPRSCCHFGCLLSKPFPSAARGPGAATPTGHCPLLRLVNGKLSRVESFETVAGGEEWYTPWGDPADVRSIAVATDGTIYVNVHVGGVARSRDGGVS